MHAGLVAPTILNLMKDWPIIAIKAYLLSPDRVGRLETRD